MLMNCSLLTALVLSAFTTANPNFGFTVYRRPVRFAEADAACREAGLGHLAILTGFDHRDRRAPSTLQLLAAMETMERFGDLKVWIGGLGDRPKPMVDYAENDYLTGYLFDASLDTQLREMMLPGRLLPVYGYNLKYPVLCQKTVYQKSRHSLSYHTRHRRSYENRFDDSYDQAHHTPLYYHYPHYIQPHYTQPQYAPPHYNQPHYNPTSYTQPQYHPQIYTHPIQTQPNVINTVDSSKMSIFAPPYTGILSENDLIHYHYIISFITAVLRGNHYQVTPPSQQDEYDLIYDFSFGKRKKASKREPRKRPADDFAYGIPESLIKQKLLLSHGLSLAINGDDPLAPLK